MAVVTTGFFDGVHLGHRHVLQTVVSSAREKGEEAVVVTFWPHPRTVLQQDARDFRLLTSLEEKKALLLEGGIDRVEVLPFTKAFAALSAAAYLDLLKKKFGASLVVMGYDNHIGADRKTAREMDASEVLVAGECPFEGGSISSTRIRKALTDGEIALANSMLGYSYGLYGVVVAGNRMGRTIGYPTANMQLYEPLKLVPGNGVYAVEAEVEGRNFAGMCNIGFRPTVGGVTRTIETHILDFSEDIYGLPLRLRFRERIRSERPFPSLEALRRQLMEDERQVRALLLP